MPERIGKITLFPKFRARRALNRVAQKVDRLKEKFDEVAKDISEAKEKAGDALSHKEFLRRAESIDSKVGRFCDISDEVERQTERSLPGKTDLEKQCKKKAAEKMGWKDARGKKGEELKKWEVLVKDCLSKGGSVGSCKL